MSNRKSSLLVTLYLILHIVSLNARCEMFFSCPKEKGKIRVELAVDGKKLLTSAPEGLWLIAIDWKDNWPCGWQYASPSEIRQAGPWTILEGELKLAAGTWRLRDAYRREGNLIRCTRRFTWLGDKTLPRCTLAVRFQVPALTKKILLPGIIYYGNPSGEKSGRVPVFHGESGDEALFEEHRYPMPFAFAEWDNDKGLWGAAIHTLPSLAPYGSVRDQWWSLGVTAGDGVTDLTLLSGPCASNGKRSVIKAVQSGFTPYPNAYLNVPPGTVIEKTFYLEVFPVQTEGAGFCTPVQSSLQLFSPFSTQGFPSFSEIIEAKYRFALTRWYESDEVAGFRKYPDRDALVMGWCGQAASLGYALQVLNPELDDPQWSVKVQKSLDFLSQSVFNKQGFCIWYKADEKQWSNANLLSQGQAMANFAWAIRTARKTGLNSRKWEQFLRKACEFHSQRILRNDWRPKSTNEAFFIAPLCEAARLFDKDGFRQAAIKAGRVYCKRHLSMREPYWGGTCDARCEDKEGAWAAFQGFLSLYLLTEDKTFLQAAEHALYVMLSYVVIWDIDMPAGRLRDNGFRTTGWTVVSPQNQHIDAYGVFFAPDVYQFGEIVGREDLKKLALVLYRSCGQLMDPFGSHGEQIQHTNFAQRGPLDDISTMRGGYQESWTVFWLTAHYLNAVARLKELGVNIGK